MLGQFILSDEIIGASTCGKVKLCINAQTLERYACKEFDLGMVNSTISHNRIMREIQVVSTLKHPNTISLVDIHVSEKKCYLVMDLVSGGELFDEVQAQQRFDEHTARFYFKQFMAGLSYCHERGIYHRDLKPENLLIDKEGVLRISDFGMATFGNVSDLTGSNSAEMIRQSMVLNTLCGTPHYIAPEVVRNRGKGYSGSKLDIWASGIILYTMLAGHLPFDGEVERVLYDIENKCVEIPRNISGSASDLLVHILDRNPHRRYSVTQILEHPWMRESAEGDTVTHQTAGKNRTACDWSRRIPESLPRALRAALYAKDQEDRRRMAMKEGSIVEEEPKISGDWMADAGPVSYSESGGANMNNNNHTNNINNNSNSSNTNNNMNSNQHNNDNTNTEYSNIYHTTDNTNTYTNEDDSYESKASKAISWCRTRIDYDMVPNMAEFGVDAETLGELWETGLAMENMHRSPSYDSGTWELVPVDADPLAQPLQAVEQWEIKEGVPLYGATGESGDLPILATRYVEKNDAQGIVSRFKEIGSKLRAGKDETVAEEELESSLQGMSPTPSASLQPASEESQEEKSTTVTAQVEEIEEAVPVEPAREVTNGAPSSPKPVAVIKSYTVAPSQTVTPPHSVAPPSSQMSEELKEIQRRERSIPIKDTVPVGVGKELLNIRDDPANKKRDKDETVITAKKWFETRQILTPSPDQGISIARPGTVDGYATSEARSPHTQARRGVRRKDGGNWAQRSDTAISQKSNGSKESILKRTNSASSAIAIVLVPLPRGYLFSRRTTARYNPLKLKLRSSTELHSLLEPAKLFSLIESLLWTWKNHSVKQIKSRAREFRMRFKVQPNENVVNVVKGKVCVYQVDVGISGAVFTRTRFTEDSLFMKFYAKMNNLYCAQQKMKGQLPNGAEVEVEDQDVQIEPPTYGPSSSSSSSGGEQA